jgi:hypothetical protein
MTRWFGLQYETGKKGMWEFSSGLLHSVKSVVSRREDNIKMDLRERGFGDVDWIHLAQDRDRWRALVNTVMNLRVP